MTVKGIRIGRVFGIPIELNISWFFIVLLIAWTFAESILVQFYDRFPELQFSSIRWILGFMAAILLFGSVLVHELSHSYVAKRFGIPVERVTLFMFGGVAQLQEEPRSPKIEFLVAVAGPAASALVAVCSYGIASILPPYFRSLKPVLMHLVMVNLFILGFNLVPGFPLDGGRILRALIWAISRNFRLSTLISSIIGRVFAIFLIVFGISIPLFFDPHNFIGGIWLVMIGFFLYQAAEMGYISALYPHLVRTHKLGEYILKENMSLRPDQTLFELADKALKFADTSFFPVVDSYGVRGVVDIRELLRIERDKWQTIPISQVMLLDTPLCQVDVETNIVDALNIILHSPGCYILLVDKGNPLRILSTKDVSYILSRLREEGFFLPKV